MAQVLVVTGQRGETTPQSARATRGQGGLAMYVREACGNWGMHSPHVAEALVSF